MSEDEPALGPCCICEGTEDVRSIIMLPLRGPVPGYGWGCVQCGVPPDGAIAVLCDRCLKVYLADQAALRFACVGYPTAAERVPIADLPQEKFDHDLSKHPEREEETR
jgi:hypothetical protein